MLLAAEEATAALLFLLETLLVVAIELLILAIELAFEDVALAAVDDATLVTTGELLDFTEDAIDEAPVLGVLEAMLAEESLAPTNSERM